MAVVGSGGYHLSRSEVLFCAESSPPSQSDLDVRWGCRRLQRDLILSKRESQIRSVSYTHQSGLLAGGGWRDRRLLAVAAQIDRYVQYRQTPSRGAFGESEILRLCWWKAARGWQSPAFCENARGSE